MTAIPADAPVAYRAPGLRATALAGFATIVAAFGGFFGWASLAELDSAAIAPGMVIVDSHRKTVQHLEGGILRELLVAEGDRVVAGQPLLVLDRTRVAAELSQLEGRYWGARARLTRLVAERAGRPDLRVPPEVQSAASNPALADMLDTEQRLFRSRRETHDGAVSLLRQRIVHARAEIRALEALSRATAAQLAFVNEELSGVRQLYDRGFERRPRLLELQRSAAELDGQSSDLAVRIAQAEQTIVSAELEIINLENERITGILDDLRETQTELAELDQRIRAARDVVERTVITAPQDGLVTDLQFFTPGGVIGAGTPILDIVPLGDELIVEARVDPRDIDSVHAGLDARVRLIAYSARRVPVVEGTVTVVSADLITEETTGDSYYTARIRLSEDSLAEVDSIDLYPGMPAEVFITTGERLAIDYILAPITNAIARAGREE